MEVWDLTSVSELTPELLLSVTWVDADEQMVLSDAIEESRSARSVSPPALLLPLLHELDRTDTLPPRDLSTSKPHCSSDSGSAHSDPTDCPSSFDSSLTFPIMVGIRPMLAEISLCLVGCSSCSIPRYWYRLGLVGGGASLIKQQSHSSSYYGFAKSSLLVSDATAVLNPKT